jgi:hypothetical protein
MSQPVSDFVGRTSPLRRIIGLLGLVALVPTAWLLWKGDITLTDAGKRAFITLVAVRVVLRLTVWGIGHVVGFLERADHAPEATAGDHPT